MTDRLSATHVDLDAIRVRFATFRAHSAQERERLARERPAAGVAEHVLLDTCHRVELVSVEAGAASDGSQVAGRHAIARVFNVVAGFDSAVVAKSSCWDRCAAPTRRRLLTGRPGPS